MKTLHTHTHSLSLSHTHTHIYIYILSYFILFKDNSRTIRVIKYNLQISPNVFYRNRKFLKDVTKVKLKVNVIVMDLN